MEESTTYQAIIRKGRLSGVRQISVRLGRKRFGPADDATEATLNAIQDVEKLEQLGERVLDVDSWQEFLHPTRRRRRNGHR